MKKFLLIGFLVAIIYLPLSSIGCSKQNPEQTEIEKAQEEVGEEKEEYQEREADKCMVDW